MSVEYRCPRCTHKILVEDPWSEGATCYVCGNEYWWDEIVAEDFSYAEWELQWRDYKRWSSAMDFEHLGIIVRGEDGKKRQDMAIALTTEIYADTQTICDPLMGSEVGFYKGGPVNYFYVYSNREEIQKLIEHPDYAGHVVIIKAGVPEWTGIDRSIPTDKPVKVVDSEPDSPGVAQ